MSKLIIAILILSTLAFSEKYYTVHQFEVQDPRYESYGPCYTPYPKPYDTYDECQAVADSTNQANAEFTKDNVLYFIITRVVCMDFSYLKYMRTQQPSYCK